MDQISNNNNSCRFPNSTRVTWDPLATNLCRVQGSVRAATSTCLANKPPKLGSKTQAHPQCWSPKCDCTTTTSSGLGLSTEHTKASSSAAVGRAGQSRNSRPLRAQQTTTPVPPKWSGPFRTMWSTVARRRPAFCITSSLSTGWRHLTSRTGASSKTGRNRTWFRSAAITPRSRIHRRWSAAPLRGSCLQPWILTSKTSRSNFKEQLMKFRRMGNKINRNKIINKNYLNALALLTLNNNSSN